MISSGFNIKDYDMLVSCYGDSSNNVSFGLVRIREAELNIIDRLSSTGMVIYDGRLYRLMRHRPYVTSKVVEMVVYEDTQPATNNSPPLHLVYHDISDAHDIFIHNGLIYIVSSGTNEIVCLNEKNFKIVKRIKFDGTGNAWHINCLSVIDGRICISAFNICSDNFGWGKTPTKGAGFIMDVETKEKIWEGLSMPHNPYQVGDKIAVCNSNKKRSFS